MTKLKMNHNDIGELYFLLHMYIMENNTGQRDLELLTEVAGLYCKNQRLSTASERPAAYNSSLPESPAACSIPPEPAPDVFPGTESTSAPAESGGVKATVASSGSVQDVKEQIRRLHQDGDTIRAIATQVHKSTSYVHRVIHGLE